MVIKYHHSSLCLSHVLQKMCVIKEPTRKLPTLSYLPKTSYCLMWDRCMTGLWKPGRQPTALPPRIGGDIGPSFQSSSRELPNNNNNTRLHPSLSFWRYGSCSHFNGLERPMSGAISAMRSRSGSRELGRGSSSVPFSRIGSSVQSFFGSLASRVQAKPSSVQPSSQTSFAKKMGPQCRSFSTISTSRSRRSNTYTPCFGRYWRRWRLGVPHASDRSKPSMRKPLLPVPKIHL